MSTTQLIICGSIAIDRIMNFSGQYKDLIDPNSLHVLSVSVLVDSLEVASGGTGANIAYNLAKLGEKPLLLGSAGSDATQYIASLESAGVNTSSVHTSNLPTASFNVLTDKSDNQVGGFFPGAMSDAESLSFAPWAGDDVLVCISAHDPAAMRRQVEECAAHKIRMMYDPGQQVSNVPAEDLKAGIAAAEIVIVNEYELGILSQKTGLSEAELQAAVPVFIYTHGERGSTIQSANSPDPISVGSAKPGQIADPTGAGDAYRAGFLYGYVRKWELGKCGKLGAVVASFVLEQSGTQVDISPSAVTQRYKQTFNEEIVL